MGRRFSGLILDWAGGLATNVVEVIESFEARENLTKGLFLSRWTGPRGTGLYRHLELGEITQTDRPRGPARDCAPDSREWPILANIWTLPASAASSIGRAADS